MIKQSLCHLPPKSRGFHLITDDILNVPNKMPPIQTGILHLFLQHTSASLTISENTCLDVRQDLETFFNHLIPDSHTRYRHSQEGMDDMPAHIKSVIIGTQLTIPLREGRMALGQWQGIYLCEHRNEASGRRIVLTTQGTDAYSPNPSQC